MKRNVMISIVAVFLIATTIMLCACNGKTDTQQDGTPSIYTIQYTDDAGLHTITVESGALYSLESIPQRNGYEFLGLYDAKVGGTQYVDENGNCLSAFKDNCNLVLYPQFKAKEYTLVLNYGEAAATGIRQMTVSYGQTIAELPMNLYVDNKIFTGWYTEENKGGVQVADANGVIPQNAIVDENTFDLSDPRGFINLYAGFKGQEYLVTFYYGDDPTPEEMMIEYGTYVTDVVTTRRIDGKAVITWSKSRGSNAQNDIFTGQVTSSMVLYAYEYAPVIDFDVSGGKPIKSIIAKQGTPIVLPTPEKENYKFVGWYTSGGQHYTSTVMQSDSVKLIAHWQAKLIFNTNGGTAVEDISEPVGTKITLPTTEKDGYLFAGWYTEQGQEYVASSMPDFSIKLFAKYYSVLNEKIILLDSSSTMKVANNTPSVAKSCFQLDLSNYYNDGISSISISIHYDAIFEWWNVGKDKTYLYTNWYNASSASDGYKIYSCKDCFDKNDGIAKYTFNHELKLDVEVSKYYISMFVSDYNYTIMDGAFAATISNCWVDIEYPDMSKLY